MELLIRKLRDETATVGILVIGAVITLIAFSLLRASFEQDARDEFELVADETSETLALAVNQDIAITENIRDFYHASENVTQDEFLEFVERTLLLNASIQALEWIPRVASFELGTFESEMRLSGNPNFRVTERDENGDLVPVSPRDEYFPVTFVEPFESNKAAHGFDLGSSPARLETLSRSADTGEPIATGRITLVQEIGDQFGFLVFVPIYSGDENLTSVSERRDKLKGFALGVYRIGDLVTEAFATEQIVAGIEAVIRDTTDPDNPEFLVHLDVNGDGDAAAHTDPGFDDSALFQTERTIEVGGRTWTLSLDPLPGFFEPNRQSLLILVVGGVITLAVGGAIHTWQSSTRTRLASASELARELATLIDTANAPIFGIDVDGNVNEWNRQAGEVTGYSRDEAIGHNLVDDFITADYRKDVWRVLENALDGRDTSNYEFPIFTKSGARVLILLSATARRDINNEIIGVLGVGQDITEIDAYRTEIENLNAGLERTVVARTESLREANAEMEAFTYSVSHDLRAPLRSMDGFSLALLEDYEADLDETAKDYLQRIRSASQRMGDLIDDLLQLSRITQQHINPRSIDLSELAGEIVDELRESDPERVVDVKIPLEAVVTADPVLMRSVMQNLIGNAWKFSAERASAIMEFGVDDTGDERVYFVKDNGAGFDSRYEDKLFAPFQRLHSDEEFEGTGIGLATAYRIITRHGGRIWAESEVGSGATFYFTLSDQPKVATND